MARPTKLNKSLQTQLVKLIKTGVTVVDACAHVGITDRTFYDWMAKGEAGDGDFLQFSQAVNRARNAAKITAIGTLHGALASTTGKSRMVDTFTETRTDTFGRSSEVKTVKAHEVITVYPADWRAAVEYLKRRFPGEWSEKRILELGLSDDLLKRLEDVAQRADLPASQLFEEMVNALAAQLSDSGADGSGESPGANRGGG